MADPDDDVYDWLRQRGLDPDKIPALDELTRWLTTHVSITAPGPSAPPPAPPKLSNEPRWVDPLEDTWADDL